MIGSSRMISLVLLFTLYCYMLLQREVTSATNFFQSPFVSYRSYDGIRSKKVPLFVNFGTGTFQTKLEQHQHEQQQQQQQQQQRKRVDLSNRIQTKLHRSLQLQRHSYSDVIFVSRNVVMISNRPPTVSRTTTKTTQLWSREGRLIENSEENHKQQQQQISSQLNPTTVNTTTFHSSSLSSSNIIVDANDVTLDKVAVASSTSSSEATETATLEELETVAITGTVNERLLLELEAARRKELYGARSQSSTLGKKQRRFGLDSFRSTQRKTDEERRLAIEDARNLNGINPLTAFVGSAIALGVAALLWVLTNFLAETFAMQPVEQITDMYFAQRVTYVYRNVVMGLVSLCAGFFGVTGVGIFLLAVRVAYGVLIGELDPSPIQPVGTKIDTVQTSVDFSNVWDLMLNKKPGRKGR